MFLRHFLSFSIAATIMLAGVGAADAEFAPTPRSSVPECEELLALRVQLRVPGFLQKSEEASVWRRCGQVLEQAREGEEEQFTPQLAQEAQALIPRYTSKLKAVALSSEEITLLRHQRRILGAWTKELPASADAFYTCESVDEVVARWFVDDDANGGPDLGPVQNCHREFIEKYAPRPSDLDIERLDEYERDMGPSQAAGWFLVLLIAGFILYRLTRGSP